jgi:glutathione synthase/RimK-type ligase-like ATP-grasp enzyme/uncharacterized protein YbcV (DUF1398 family)
MAILVVVNNPKDFSEEIDGVEVISAKSYLSDDSYQQLKGVRVFNLCRSFSYQSTGYYISLLAAARGHKVIPDITTIQDTKTQSIIRIKSEELHELIQKSLEPLKVKEFEFDIYFGKTPEKQFQFLAKQLFYHFPAPLLRAYFGKRGNKWYLQDIDPISSKSLFEEQKEFMYQYANSFFNNKKLAVKKAASYSYELAILVNDDDTEPPSNKKAIKKFRKAAETLGIGAWNISRDDYNQLGEYDALFIRETTNVNHYTYRFARRAAVEGLVVIDDPMSILRCSNKVYLAELMSRHNIPTPKTMVIHKDNTAEILKNFKLPVIIKMPDSCFSLGVKKAEDEVQLEIEVKKMLAKSDVIIVQEFIPTDFDWRIGIIDKKPLYACKYYMADHHWQIMNWNKKGDERYGASETMPIEKAPDIVVQTALKAANLIGDGLYGVDLKQVNGKTVVIEINDNPSIDSGIEDEVLNDELYLKIMEVFLARMQKKKGINGDK